MLIVLGLYAGLIWLIFFKLKVLPWTRATKIAVSFVGLIILLVVVGLLNTRTPSGRVTVMARVVQIAPVVGGVVVSVPVEPNLPVAKGTVLFEIDKTPYQASLDGAKADYEIAEITYARKLKLGELNSSSTSQQDIDVARATAESAKARMDRAQYDLDQTVVVAPSDGVVSSLGVSVGDQARPLKPVMPFIRTDSMILGGIFAQNGTNALSPGTPVQIVFDRKPGQIYTSKVVVISPGSSSGQVSSGANLLGAQDLGSVSEALVVLAWPDGLDRSEMPAGAVGSATAISEDAGAIGLLATVLLYFKMLETYL